MENSYTYRYPHPALTADCVLFAFDGASLSLLLIERKNYPCAGMWALPGGFLEPDETIEQCARRELAEETHLDGIELEQYHVFSEPDRDPRERVVTVAFFGLVDKRQVRPTGDDDARRAQWFSLDELPPLAFDHDQVIALAKRRLAERYKLDARCFCDVEARFEQTEIDILHNLITSF